MFLLCLLAFKVCIAAWDQATKDGDTFCWLALRGKNNSRRYTCSSHGFGYSFPFSLIVLGVRAIVLGFRVRVRIRGLGDQNYEVGFETIGTVTQNYGNCSIATISRKKRTTSIVLIHPA